MKTTANIPDTLMHPDHAPRPAPHLAIEVEKRYGMHCARWHDGSWFVDPDRDTAIAQCLFDAIGRGAAPSLKTPIVSVNGALPRRIGDAPSVFETESSGEVLGPAIEKLINRAKRRLAVSAVDLGLWIAGIAALITIAVKL